MKQRKWLYKPEERSDHKEIAQATDLSGDKLDKFLTLTEDYSDAFPARRVLVLNDNKDIVFFVQLNDDMTATKDVHVFLWNGLQYLAASPEISTDISKKYFDYLDVVALAYQHLEGEKTE